LLLSLLLFFFYFATPQTTYKDNNSLKSRQSKYLIKTKGKPRFNHFYVIATAKVDETGGSLTSAHVLLLLFGDINIIFELSSFSSCFVSQNCFTWE